MLNAAIPRPGAPQLQYLDLHYASMGYGDVFVAGVLGGVLAAERPRAVARRRCSCSCCSASGTCCSSTINTLPATVPVAVALADPGEPQVGLPAAALASHTAS